MQFIIFWNAIILIRSEHDNKNEGLLRRTYRGDKDRPHQGSYSTRQNLEKWRSNIKEVFIKHYDKNNPLSDGAFINAMIKL